MSAPFPMLKFIVPFRNKLFYVYRLYAASSLFLNFQKVKPWPR